MFAGNLAAAVLRGDTERPAVPNRSYKDREHTCTNTFSGMETMRVGEKEWKGRNGDEVEREVSGGEEGKEEGSAEVERKEDRSVGGEFMSMKMESWVEVENERKSAEEVDERSVEEDERRSAEEVEKEQTCSVEEELARMEEKWAEQCAINETLKQRLANEEERFRVSHPHTHNHAHI